MRFAITQAPYTAAMSARAAVSAHFSVTVSPSYTYGPGLCQGTSSAERDGQIPPTIIRSFFTAWAGSLGTPHPGAVGSTMAGLILSASGGFQPDPVKIQRDWDGALSHVHGHAFLPAVHANLTTQSAHDVRVFWRDAAQVACEHFVSTDPMVTWVAVRFMEAEMEGLSPNPFAPWMG